MDYYQTLGVQRNASPEDLKKAYKKQSMQHHPDRGGSEAKFKEINEAYTALKDPQKRAMYDQYGTTDPQQAGGSQSYSFRTGPGGFNVNDIFEQFGFGARQQMRNRDITIGCNINIEEVYNGKQIIVSYRLANGKEQTVDLNIPVGVRQGDKIRFQGMGQHDIPQIPPGDLFVQVNIMSTNDFEVHGLDLITSRRINVLKLITGCTTEIKTPNGGVIALSIKPGTQPNTTLRLTGKGLPNMRGNPGSILVKLIGQVPSGLDKDDIQQIEQIQQKYA
jgi:molecular chaperone DnaJ